MVAEIQMKCMSENSPIPDDDAALNASCGKFYVELTLLKYHFGLGNIAGCIERERERERETQREEEARKKVFSAWGSRNYAACAVLLLSHWGRFTYLVLNILY